MATARVFAFSDYRDYVRSQVETASESWGLITQLAKAAGCQRSYFSRVLSGQVHLTPDHAYALCAHWKLPPDETEGFLCLLEASRASSPQFKNHLKSKFLKLKRTNENLSNRLAKPKLEPGERENTYYSSWQWAALHIASSIPALQTAGALAQHLQIPLPVVRATLNRLEAYGLVKQETPGRWVHHSSELHVSSSSALVTQHHSNWRHRALLDSQLGRKDSIHYTMVQSMSLSAYESIRQKLLEFIDESVQIGGPSDSEELVCLTCDFYRT